MGVVYRAWDLKVGRAVAIKLVRRPSAALIMLFEREVRMLGGLEHDHVVRVYDAGLATDGAPFLILELVPGKTLSAWLAAGRPLVVESARLALQIAAGLRAAHERGIAHLDLKPANVFLDASGRAKVADFGLARVVSAAPSGPDIQGGTPGYMPPEQAAGGGGLPADVFAIGVILHEMLTGRRLFPRREPIATPAPPSQVNPSVSRSLDELVASCLAPDPGPRPTIDTVLDALSAWLATTRRDRVRPGAAGFPLSPYKLLAHYAPEDAPIFFARQAEVEELAALLDRPTLRLLQLYGPCGIGKSSLLGAGLEQADAAGRRVVRMTAGPDPARRIREVLVALGGKPDGPLVLVLDQAEEVFTQLRQSAAAAELFAQLVRIAEQPTLPVQVVLAYRTEFRGDFAPLEEQLGHQQHSVHLRAPAAPAGAGPVHIRRGDGDHPRADLHGVPPAGTRAPAIDAFGGHGVAGRADAGHDAFGLAEHSGHLPAAVHQGGSPPGDSSGPDPGRSGDHGGSHAGLPGWLAGLSRGQSTREQLRGLEAPRNDRPLCLWRHERQLEVLDRERVPRREHVAADLISLAKGRPAARSSRRH